MKKQIILALSLLCLIACGNNSSSTIQPSITTPTTVTPTTIEPTTTVAPTTTATPTTQTPTTVTPTTQKPTDNIEVSLKDLMTAYKLMGNYTYTIIDEIFDVTSTLRYTPKAYYYEPSKTEHGGEAYGYAENSRGVFTYKIEDGEVVLGDYITSASGSYVKDMWFTTIVSFVDIEIGLLPDEPVEGHKYLIEDATNKLLISALAGYGDTVLQSYIDVYIEITSNTTFKTIVHTARLSGDYIGCAFGVISNVGSTIIPEIEELLLNDGGPELLDEELLNFLKKLKEGRNYKITTEGSVNYVDSYTARNYYSKNNDDDSLSKGYATSSDGVFKYTIKDGEVQPGEVINDGSNGVFDVFWGKLPNFFSFESLNLSLLTYTKTNDVYNITNTSIIGTFADITHIGSGSVDEKSTLKVTLTDTSLSFVLVAGDQTVNGLIDSIGTTSIPEIEEFMKNGGGPLEYQSIDDKGRSFINSLSKAKNYTLDIVSTYPSNSFTLEKKYTSSAYYQASSKEGQSFGYYEQDDGIYEFTYNNDSIVKGNKQGDGYYVWSSNLFKSFKNIDSTTVQGKKISENTYTITDNNTKNEIYQLAGFSIYDLMFISKGITLTITDETKLECVIKIDLGTSGSVTITSKDVGNTIIQGL